MNTLIALLVAWLVFEFLEHVLIPLFGLIKNRGKHPQFGVPGMIGKIVDVRQWDKTKGQVLINGEFWKGECETPLAVGSKAIIDDINGLTLKLKPYKPNHKTKAEPINSEPQN